MNKLSVIFVLVAIACSVHGIFHFKHQFNGGCDVQALIRMHHTNMSYVMNLAGHGHFIRMEDFTCSKFAPCERVSTSIDRPDLAPSGYKVREYDWYPGTSGYECNEKYLHHVSFNPYSLYEGWFETRVPVIFHSRRCYAYSNTTSDTVVYGDHETGELLGADVKGGFHYTVEVDAPKFKYTPNDFIMDRLSQFQCEQESTVPADQQYFKDACNDIPTPSPSFKFW